MLIERTSMLSGTTSTMELPITQEQIAAWEAGGLAQNVMPNLTDGEREFFMTGITPEEWVQNFPPAIPDAETADDARTVIVPNYVDQAINERLDTALADCPDAVSSRPKLYAQLLDHYDRTGQVPSFTLVKDPRPAAGPDLPQTVSPSSL